MTLEMFSYHNGSAYLFFRYVREKNLEIDSIKLIPNTDSPINTMIIYVWCTEEQKEELLHLKKIDDKSWDKRCSI